jgi:7,8-didemethyl-8-hydroxy-5-deazariboflavin synthase CofH subunit/7,8-didemethyl-8-hydroxy-5-deazariboflavin synthase CofG subunit
MSQTLTTLPTSELMLAAAEKRHLISGNLITYSPKAFFPLTMLCQNRCGYCTFAKAPPKSESAYMELDEILGLAKRSEALGVKEALFTLGEKPELRYAVARNWLQDRGYKSTTDYLYAAAAAINENTSLLVHTNAGAISTSELERLREVAVSQGMMLETTNDFLACHRLAPDKSVDRRMATLRSAGKAGIAFTTGILVGIGEDESERIRSLEAILDLHLEFGHIQEVIVQNFLPKARTSMADTPPPSLDTYQRAIALARLILSDDIVVQAPPNLSEDVTTLLNAGVSDFGGISPITIDHVNPERPWPHIEILTKELESNGFTLAPRLAIQPRFSLDPKRWLDPNLHHRVLVAAESSGLAREDEWVSGGAIDPPTIRSKGASVVKGAVSEVLDGIISGQSLGQDEILTLFSARGSEIDLVCEAADQLRRQISGDAITFVNNRNINYTNICTFKCRFCAFSKGPLSLNLRGNPYLLELEEVQQRVLEAEVHGATEVCLQGGIHPSFDAEYYLSLVKSIRSVSPSIHIHAFSALEVYQGATRAGLTLRNYLTLLKDAGLRTLPGTAAEILDDEIRSVLCPDKIDTDTWLEVHRTAHEVGLNSNVTIMFGSIEEPRHWVKHILATRNLQLKTSGFTEFVPLPFVHMGSPIYLQGRSRKGPTFRETLLMHAVGRLSYSGAIDNIQASWVKMGPKGTDILLRSGCNDLGGTLMDENISHAAGSEHGRSLEVGDFIDIAQRANRPLKQRNTLYGIVNHKPAETWNRDH